MAKVAIIKDKNMAYDGAAPFHPAEGYPEYPFKPLAEKNSVYAAVRALFHHLGLDTANYNQPHWNPLGEVIRPGDTVVLKPNFVKHHNPADSSDCLLTHGSVVRAVVDYVYIALKGRGHIIIADAPLQSCDFAQLTELVGLDKIVDFYGQQAGTQITLTDLRLIESRNNIVGLRSEKRLEGDLSGYVSVDLGQDSELAGIADGFERYRVTCYNKEEMVVHHNRLKNEYLIPKSILEADVIIDLPKLKTHRKAGMTCAMKNLVGINGFKDWLPHHRTGSVEEGGDEYLHKSFRKRLETRLVEKRDVTANTALLLVLLLACKAIRFTEAVFPPKDPYREGSWYGNDTLPRTIADLNRIALYADRTGTMQHTMQRKMLIVVDAVVAGEKEGPLRPSAKDCGLLLAGFNPVAVDLVCSRLMGFDYKKIPQFKYAMKKSQYALLAENFENIEITAEGCKSIDDVRRLYGEKFIPAKGWLGHIEL